jgi:hypothetical protein
MWVGGGGIYTYLSASLSAHAAFEDDTGVARQGQNPAAGTLPQRGVRRKSDWGGPPSSSGTYSRISTRGRGSGLVQYGASKLVVIPPPGCRCQESACRRTCSMSKAIRA